MDKILNLPISNKHLWEKHQWYADTDENIVPIIRKNKYEILIQYSISNFGYSTTEHSNKLNQEREGISIQLKGNPFKLLWYRDNFIIH